MILSVSRRTDIPAFYSEWFYNRIHAGFVYVRNPINAHQISKIKINPDVIDCIVFWTKNPSKMIPRLEEIKEFNFYFQFTINPYGKNLETCVPSKKYVIETFRELSNKIGVNRVIWRYDPILLSKDIDINYHIKYFDELSTKLAPYTNKCVISFLDNYRKTEENLRTTTARALTDDEIATISKEIGKIANEHHIQVMSCAEKYDLENYGIMHGRCIDNELIENIIKCPIIYKKDKNQRKECGCIESIDIGEYNTCSHNCLYCYANFNRMQVSNKRLKHNPESPLLIGNINDGDKIIERKVFSFRDSLLF
jgi:DNA repair photolyase